MNHEIEYNKQYTDMVKRHEKTIFNVCFFYASANTPFEDLRQEVLLALFKSYKHFRNESSESTWIYKVCINTCLFSLRKLSTKIKTFPIEELPILNQADDKDENFRNRLEWLYKTISILSPMDKALILMWLDGLKYEEIADNMGIPRNTVASRLHRIKEKISSKKEL